MGGLLWCTVASICVGTADSLQTAPFIRARKTPIRPIGIGPLHLRTKEEQGRIDDGKIKVPSSGSELNERGSFFNMPILQPMDELSLDEAPAKNSSPSSNQEGTDDETTKLVIGAGVALVFAATIALLVKLGDELGLPGVGQFVSDPPGSFDEIISSLDGMDKQKAVVYFGIFYVLAEILAIPAFPLTAASGYLFGAFPGTATCLFSAAIAASISFVIGKTLLRGYVEDVLDENPKFRSMDRAIEKEGFKLMVLLRLSPLFPFALSNYLYGASSIRFPSYFFGTILGFAPGTFAYVYGGVIGKELTVGGDHAQPWYIYAGGMAIIVGLIKVIGDVATSVIDTMEDDES